MTRPTRSSEPASEEFSETVRWYEARRSGPGGEFFDAVGTTLSLIETNPEIGTTLSADDKRDARWWMGFRTRSYTDSSPPSW